MDQESNSGRSFGRQYQYQDLVDTDIRCVQLDPSAEHHQGHLTSHKRLNGTYSALSYEWGPSRPLVDTRVRITDESGRQGFLPITPNLRNAIVDLKACSLKTGAIFIDQLCINQQNNAEKSTQVAGMKDVYKCADQVIVYLGPAQAGDSEAFDLLKNLDDNHGDWFDSLEVPQLRKAQQLGFHQVFDDSETPNLSAEDASILRSLCPSLFESGWTKRLWMRQEAVLNKTVIFLKGPRFVSARSIFLLFFTARDYRFNDHIGRVIMTDMSVAVWNIFVTQRESDRGGWGKSLLSVMEKHSTSLACSDPRDKVYAVLGLAHDALGIIPDYHADTVEVFTDLAKRCIQGGRDLAVFRQISRWTDEDNRPSYLQTTSCWPSWVPTFEGHPAWSTAHHAGGSTLAMTRIDSAQRILKITGFQIAEIETIATMFGYYCDKFAETVNWNSAHLFIATITAARDALASKDVHDAERRLCYGLMDTTSHIPDVISDKALQCFLDVLQLSLGPFLQDPPPTPLLFSDSPEGDLARELVDIPLLFGDSSDGELAREFFLRFSGEESALCITTMGEVIVAPNAVQTGDIATVLPGGSEVYVLRSIEDDRFHMIGLAYADGYMKGEAITDVEWEKELLRILLNLISEKMPASFTGIDTYSFGRAKYLVELLQFSEDLGGPSAATAMDSPAKIEAFQCSASSKQSEILRRCICKGLDTPVESLNAKWRKEWWNTILSWIEEGYLRPPSWIEKLRAYTIV